MIFKSPNHALPKFEIEKKSEGQLTCVIGDVHGCSKVLNVLLKKLELLRQTLRPKRLKLVFLGDLIDRGSNSRQVIQDIITLKSTGYDITVLMGNHEQVFLNVMRGNISELRPWFEHGGIATARSYGVEDLGAAYIDPENTLKQLKKHVPEEHIDFIATFKDCYVFDKYACVHAGIKPKTALMKQDPQDLRWIREKFLHSKIDHKYVIVHGHTIVHAPEIWANRIAIDTGSYETGIITAAYFYESKLGFLRSDDLPANFCVGVYE